MEKENFYKSKSFKIFRIILTVILILIAIKYGEEFGRWIANLK